MPQHKQEKTLNFGSLISIYKPLHILQASKHSLKIVISETSGLLATGFLLSFEVLNPRDELQAQAFG